MSCKTFSGKDRTRAVGGTLSPEEQQRRMDQISLGFCERLYVVNGFVTEIVAGHVKRIGSEMEEHGTYASSGSDASGIQETDGQAVHTDGNFAVVTRNGIVVTIGRSEIVHPQIRFRGGAVNWYDDQKGIKGKAGTKEEKSLLKEGGVKGQ